MFKVIEKFITDDLWNKLRRVYPKVNDKRLAKRDDYTPIRSDDINFKGWEAFNEMINSKEYFDFVSDFLGTTNFKIVPYFQMYHGTSNNLRPHIDTGTKIGAHLFYFNKTNIGGELEIYNGRFVYNKKHQNDLLYKETKLPINTTMEIPEFGFFEDLTKEKSIKINGNKSIIFKNTPNAIHGVAKIKKNEIRKVLLVTFKVNDEKQGLVKDEFKIEG